MTNEKGHAEHALAARHARTDAELVKEAAHVLMHQGLAAAEAYLRANGVQVQSSDCTVPTTHPR